MRRLLLLPILFIAIILNAQTPCEDGFAGEYPCNGIDLLSITPSALFEGSSGVNDIWGWTDADGREFALIGTREGSAFVEVTNPLEPRYLGYLPSHIITTNTWRDIKVYADHAFIVSEIPQHGMQVLELTQLSALTDDEIPVIFEESAHYDGFGRTHNVAINEETGYAYPIGANQFFNGGPQFINIQDPLNPVLEGGFAEEGYSHDAQIVIYTGPDVQHQGKEIYFGSHGGNGEPLVIVDVSDKVDPQLISTASYNTIGYCHQGWLTENQRYYLSNDETDETSLDVPFTRTHMWDLLDLDNPIHLGFYESPTPSSDHNLYIKGNFCYQSNYQSGLRILDISDIGNAQLEEVAFFDVYPQNDNAGFQGTWSNYPYFESGNIIVTHRQLGLFVVRPSEGVLSITPEEPTVNFASLTYNRLDRQLKVSYPTSMTPASLKVIDVRGREITGVSVSSSSDSQATIDVATLNTGAYFVLIEGRRREVLRFLID